MTAVLSPIWILEAQSMAEPYDAAVKALADGGLLGRPLRLTKGQRHVLNVIEAAQTHGALFGCDTTVRVNWHRREFTWSCDSAAACPQHQGDETT